MFAKIWKWLFGPCEKPNLGRYNFDPIFKDVIPLGETVTLVLDLARHVQYGLEISFTQAEIILFVMNYPVYPDMLDVEEYMAHISEAHARRLTKKLVKSGYLISFTENDVVKYEISNEVLEFINNYTYL